MGRRSSIPGVVIVIVLILMELDTRILAGIICIPTGIIMLKQWHHTDSEDSEEYDKVAIIGGIGMLASGIFITISYFLL